MRWLAGVLVVVLAACARGGSDAGVPEVPQPVLRPLLPELERLAAAGPAPPEARRLKQLEELACAAFEPGAADARLAARSRHALLEEDGAHWALERMLEHEHPVVRSQAAFALGELGHRPSALPLVLRLKYERDPEVLLWVADALAALGNGAGLYVLVWAMDRPEQAQTAGLRAIAVLRRAGREPGAEPSYASLQAGLRELETRWLQTGLLPPREREDPPDAELTARIARRLLLLPGFQLRPVDDTRFILARCGTRGADLLRRCATAAEPYLRSHALEVLRELGPAAGEAAHDVLPLLGDPLCRADAVRTLGALRAVSAAPVLRAWLSHPDLELRAAAAGALGPIGDRAAKPLLAARMADGEEAMDVRVQAAFSLAVLELDRPGLRFLQQRLEAGDYHGPTLRELLDRVQAWR